MTRYLHTMLRITDPEKTRAFYEALGLEFRRDMDIVRNGDLEATNYFFGVPGPLFRGHSGTLAQVSLAQTSVEKSAGAQIWSSQASTLGTASLMWVSMPSWS